MSPSSTEPPRSPEDNAKLHASITTYTRYWKQYDAATQSLPRILCLHGGGTNSHIFRVQCRALIARLEPFFRLVFTDAPYFSHPGPDVVSVYREWGPFRSWVPPLPGGGFGTDIDDDTEASIYRTISQSMQMDDEAGATGLWVGVLGFSQGAKLAASILMKQQEQEGKQKHGSRFESATTPLFRTDFKFGVLMAGRPPLIPLGFETRKTDLLRAPTIHVHGLLDVDIELHRDLQNQVCKQETSLVVEWDGGHRIPIKTHDVELVVMEMLQVAYATSALSLQTTA